MKKVCNTCKTIHTDLSKLTHLPKKVSITPENDIAPDHEFFDCTCKSTLLIAKYILRSK